MTKMLDLAFKRRAGKEQREEKNKTQKGCFENKWQDGDLTPTVSTLHVNKLNPPFEDEDGQNKLKTSSNYMFFTRYILYI